MPTRKADNTAGRTDWAALRALNAVLRRYMEVQQGKKSLR